MRFRLQCSLKLFFPPQNWVIRVLLTIKLDFIFFTQRYNNWNIYRKRGNWWPTLEPGPSSFWLHVLVIIFSRYNQLSVYIVHFFLTHLEHYSLLVFNPQTPTILALPWLERQTTSWGFQFKYRSCKLIFFLNIFQLLFNLWIKKYR